MRPTPVLVLMPTLARGGAERHSVWMATTLDRSRWEPQVLAFSDGPLRSALTDAGVPVRVHSLPWAARSVPAASAAIRAAVGETAAGLVTGHHILTEAAARLALRNSPVPTLTWKHVYGLPGHRTRRERLFERATGDQVTRYGAVCHTQVRYLTDDLGLPSSKITVVPNATPSPDRPPPLPVGGPLVALMPAAMRPEKDHGLVLRAWAQVCQRYPGARLRLAGEGPRRLDLERLAIDLRIQDSVEFLGDRGDVLGLLAGAHVAVLGSYDVECFPYAALEAMSSGRAVISTNVGGMPELVDDGVTGRLVPPRDVDALADALSEGFDEARGASPTWGSSGWARGREVFGFQQWIGRIDRLFADLVNDSQGSPSTPPGRS